MSKFDHIQTFEIVATENTNRRWRGAVALLCIDVIAVGSGTAE